jgi:hypothetical protein
VNYTSGECGLVLLATQCEKPESYICTSVIQKTVSEFPQIARKKVFGKPDIVCTGCDGAAI